MGVTTDRKWKPFLYRNEVPEKVLNEDFDWLDEEDQDGFFRYRGNWYHLSEFLRTDTFEPDWQGYLCDSMFSAVVLNLSDDGEEYMVGTYIA